MRKDLDLFEYATDVVAQAEYVSSDAGGTATMTLRPNAAGDETGLDYVVGAPTHWEAVDEATPDEATTMVGSTGAGSIAARDLYNLPASGGSGTINYVKIYIRCKSGYVDFKGDAKVSLKTNGNVVDGTLISGVSENWTTYSQQWDINPVTSAAWTWGEIDALQIGVWLKKVSDNRDVYCTQVYVEVNYTSPVNLQCYSEATIKQQGSYSLKDFASITNSLNDTLTHTISPTIDLSGLDIIKFLMRSSRTGSNIKISLHNITGVGYIIEITPNIILSNTWQEIKIPLQNISNANKNAIDEIKITIINADADNIFYLDDMFSFYIPQIVIG